MSDPFVGEVKLVAFNFAPKGFALCNGQLLSIAQNQALFSLLGTTYGGNGVQTFALPDLRGRAPIHQSPQLPQGATAGEETHTLTVNEIPQHTHVLQASTATGSAGIGGNASFGVSQTTIYAPPDGTTTPIEPSTVAAAGGSLPHENRQPFLVVNYAIALVGIFPSRN